MTINKEYEMKYDYFLKIYMEFLELKRKKKISRKYIKKINHKFNLMSWWLLINDPENENNSLLKKERIELVIKSIKYYCKC